MERILKLRKVIPPRFRRPLRKLLNELPVRLRDARADLFDRHTLPPPRLRFNVAGTSSRDAFTQVGSRAAREIADAVAEPRDVLDFGCGCGRIAAPLAALWPRANMHGVDVDAAAIQWCGRNLRGDFRLLHPDDGLPFADGSFDLVYAISLFTHMDEPQQFRWLAEVRRVLREGGLLLATTHSPELAYARPDLSDDQRASLAAHGFAFAPGPAFNDNSAFHSSDYLRRAWAKWFVLARHQPYGLAGYQDLTLFEAKKA